MKLKLFLSLFICGFILSGCGTQKQLEKTVPMSKQQIFENDQMCQKRKDEVLEILHNDELSVKANSGSDKRNELVEIFYSPPENQCLYFFTSKLSNSKDTEFYAIEALDHPTAYYVEQIKLDKFGFPSREEKIDYISGSPSKYDYFYSRLREFKGQ